MADVFLTRLLPRAAMEFLGKLTPYDANTAPRKATRDELIYAVKNYKAVISMLNDNFDAEIINLAGENLKLIANYGVGFNNIDVKAAQARNIFVTNTPDVLTDATADLAFALMFAAARRVVEGDKIVRTSSFEWSPEYLLGYDISGKTLGIIGAGRIGSNFGRKAALGFNMHVIYSSNHNSKMLDDAGAKRVDFDDVIKNSDFISLHVPLTQNTRHLINSEQLEKMKPTAILINTSRGAVIDEKSLARALKRGVIAAAGFDVYENEPVVDETLKTLDNVILMPHVGSATFGTRNNMGFMVAKNVAAVLNNQEPPNLVRI